MILFVRKRGHGLGIRGVFQSATDDRITCLKKPPDAMWRWGTMVPFPGIPEVNTAVACRLASDKPAVRRLCTEMDIRVPLTFYTQEEAKAYFATNQTPLLWRPRHHRGGEQMVVCNSASEITQQGGYWSQILQKSNEYRVYVLFGRVLGVDEKIVEDRTQLAWNHSQGGVFEVLGWDQWPSIACWFSTRLTHRMGLHFGAVDLIKSDGRYYMLEVNTTPAMVTVYKSNLLRRAVVWLDSKLTETQTLPTIAEPLGTLVKGYRNYIHNLLGG